MGATVAVAAPTLTRSPANTVVVSGQNATLTVAATGSGALSYQWRRTGFPVYGATNATFVIGGVARADAGIYDVAVTDGTGTTVSAAARLLVAPRAYPTNVLRDASVDPQLEANANVAVYKILALADGGFIAAGRLARVNGVRSSLLMRINADGSVSSGFTPTIIGDEVRTIAQQADGKFVIGGHFAQVNGYRRNDLARVNADGSLDVSFNPDLAGVETVIRVLVQPDGKLVVAAWTLDSNGGLQRLNADGSLDSSWQRSRNGTVYDLALQADGKVIAAGFMNSPTGNGTTPVLRFNTDGSLDATFNVGTTTGSTNAVAIDAAGNILIGGFLTQVGGKPVTGIARLTTAGALDASFTAAAQAYGTPSNVNAIAVQADGKIVVGGGFLEMNGVAQPYLARLNRDGSLDSGFPAAAPARSLQSVAIQSDGSIVGGMDAVFIGSDVRTGVVRYNRSGFVDTRVSLNVRGPGGPGPVVPLPNGKYMLFGSFDDVRGAPGFGMVRLNGDGSVDSTFTSHGGIDVGYGAVGAAVLLPDGRFAVTGGFNTYAGVPRNYLAVIRADGSLDPTFSPAPSVLSGGECIALTPDGKIVVAGNAYSSGGPVYGGVFMYNLDGSRDTAFNTGSGFDQDVRALAVQPDGKIIAGGWFTKYNGSPVKGLVRLNRDGTADPTFVPALPFQGNVSALALTPSGKVVVAAGYLPVGSIARLNADGSLDSTFAWSALGGVSAVLVQENEQVLVRSWFPLNIGNGGYLARLNADGTLDRTFRSSGIYQSTPAGMNATLVMRDDGQLLISDGGQQAGQFYATRASSAPVLTTTPGAQVIAANGSGTLSVTAASEVPLTYQWTYNDQPIPGATAATYTISHFGAANVGMYGVAVTSDFGTVNSSPVRVAAPAYTGGRLANISVRTNTGTADATLIVGIVLGGSGTTGDKAMVFRAVGPTLTKYSIAGALPDPVLELYDGTSFKIDQNDDWTGVFDFTSVGAFPFEGAQPKDAAIYDPYVTGGHTLHIIGKNGATGVALAEAYDATPLDSFSVFTPRLINGSARTQVGTGENVLILGFVITGSVPEHILVRAVGPTLATAPFNVAGVLADPQLEIYGSASTKLAENDNWGDNGAGPTLSAAFTSVGAFALPSGSKDAALEATLPPGNYTAVVRGVGGTTGVALVELYELP